MISVSATGEDTSVGSEETKSPERDRLWNRMVTEHSLSSMYGQRTPTPVPVVLLVSSAEAPRHVWSEGPARTRGDRQE